MGFWSGVKGVFGRVKNWVKNKIVDPAKEWWNKHKDTVKKVKDTVTPFLPQEAQDLINKGEKVIKKGGEYYDKYGKLLNIQFLN